MKKFTLILALLLLNTYNIQSQNNFVSVTYNTFKTGRMDSDTENIMSFKTLVEIEPGYNKVNTTVKFFGGDGGTIKYRNGKIIEKYKNENGKEVIKVHMLKTDSNQEVDVYFINHLETILIEFADGRYSQLIDS